MLIQLYYATLQSSRVQRPLIISQSAPREECELTRVLWVIRGLRVTLDVKWVTVRQSTTVSEVTDPHPAIQRNQYREWDAVWRAVCQYLRAEGGSFINQSCLSVSDCTRELTIAGREVTSAVYKTKTIIKDDNKNVLYSFMYILTHYCKKMYIM